MIRILHLDDNVKHTELTKLQVNNIDKNIQILFADSLFNAMKLLKTEEIDGVLTDYHVSDNSGYELLKILRKKSDSLPFVFLVEEGFRREEKTSQGDVYLFNNVSEVTFGDYEELVDAIRMLTLERSKARQLGAASQDHVTSDDIERSDQLEPEAVETDEGLEAIESLTKRELEVLTLLAQGNSNKVMAQKLDISYRTVLNHVNNLYRKLEVSNRVEAIHLAIKSRLVKLN